MSWDPCFVSDFLKVITKTFGNLFFQQPASAHADQVTVTLDAVEVVRSSKVRNVVIKYHARHDQAALFSRLKAEERVPTHEEITKLEGFPATATITDHDVVLIGENGQRLHLGQAYSDFAALEEKLQNYGLVKMEAGCELTNPAFVPKEVEIWWGACPQAMTISCKIENASFSGK